MANCNKVHTGKIEGYVLYNSSNLPVEGAEIVITEDRNANSESFIARTSTDKEGYFKISYSKHLTKRYRQFLNIKKDSLETHDRINKSKSYVTIYL